VLGGGFGAKINGKWGGSEALITSGHRRGLQVLAAASQRESSYPKAEMKCSRIVQQVVQCGHNVRVYDLDCGQQTFGFYQGLADITTPSVLNDINALRWNPAMDP